MMKRGTVLLGLAALATLAVFPGATAREGSRRTGARPAWRDTFDIDRAHLSVTGRNDFFILEPGYRIVLRGRDEGRPAEVIITVTDETRVVMGIPTRVVEERESVGGRLIEVSRNFFAIDRRTKDVYYFGEDVTKYRRNGTPYDAEDAWLAGEDGARPGLIMPGTLRIGDRYYQEHAPGTAMDRSEVVSLTETVETADGEDLENCLKIIETTPLEPNERSPKFYARGIGMIYDSGLRLAEHGMMR